MTQRCHNPHSTKFFRYGARGISVTKPWRDSFEAFLNEMGERPPGTTLDRIDGRFGYFLANCRWATPTEQRQNQQPAKQAERRQQTHCKRGHLFDAANTARTTTGRYCRACSRILRRGRPRSAKRLAYMKAYNKTYVRKAKR